MLKPLNHLPLKETENHPRLTNQTITRFVKYVLNKSNKRRKEKKQTRTKPSRQMIIEPDIGSSNLQQQKKNPKQTMVRGEVLENSNQTIQKGTKAKC